EPPRSTLLPYTTLFRSVKNSAELLTYRIDVRYENIPLNKYTSYIDSFEETFDPCEGTYYFTNRCFSDAWIPRKYEYSYNQTEDRSEEHTSELQSRENLV